MSACLIYNDSMRLLKRRKAHVWQYEPYAFEVGKVYVMEVNEVSIRKITLKELESYYKRHGITIKIVNTIGDKRALQPVELVRETKYE